MKTKPLFIATALIEAGAGLGLLASPALAVSILIGAPFDTPAGSVVGRVAGAALLALALASWRARDDGHTRAAAGIVSAMLLYNVVVGLLLTYAGTSLRLFGVALWPAVAVHAVMALWCSATLMKNR
jgi:hypothetical protein